MRNVVFLALCLVICASTKPPTKKKAPGAASVTKTLLQMERDWSRAGTTKDIDIINRILADDWISVDFHGKTVNKAQAIAELKSATSSPPAIEFGDMKVRVLGTTAIVTGADRSGGYVWMDVFMKRNGNWQAVASQSTKVEK